MIKVSVIIPAYHDWDRLQLCLNALEKQEYPVDSFEIIAVNNDPKDKMPAGFKIPANCNILEEGKPGSYAARNTALKIAKGHLIGFTDSDCIPDIKWIKNAVELFDKKSELIRIGGRVKLFYKNKRATFSELYDMVFAFPQSGYVNDMGWAVTANLFVRREIFDTVGVFNDSLMSGGDHEFGKRALNKGIGIIYGEDIIVNHPARDSFGELLKKSKRVNQGIADLKFKEGYISPSLLKKKYIIFRFRLNELNEIKKKIKEFELGFFNVYIVLMLRNLVFMYGDYHFFKRISFLKGKKI